jgi:hypothetical protein
MCKTNRAKKYLERIAMIDALIESELYEKKQWKETEDRVYGTTTSWGESALIDGVLHNVEKIHGGGLTSSPTESAAIASTYIESQYDERIKRLHDEKKSIIKTLEELEVEEFRFLHKVYVQHLTLKEAACAFGNSYSWATSIHGRALKNLEDILMEREKRWKEREIALDGTQQETTVKF